MIYQDESGLMDLPPPRLPGRHQFANAAAAIAAVKAAGFEIGHRAADRAMTSVAWPGRMQRLPQGRAGRTWRPKARKSGSTAATIRAPASVIAEALVEQEERFSRPLFLICRHDQHQGPDRLFPRLQGHGPPRLHRAGERERRRRAERASWPRAPSRPGFRRSRSVRSPMR